MHRPPRVTRSFIQLWAAAVAALAVVASVVLVASPAAADAIRDREYWLSGYGITEAWGTTRGAGVTIAVIDTGVDGSHPDLTGQVIGGADFTGHGSADGQTPIGKESEHGTLVASVLAGHGHGAGNASGVIGVAPEAKILAVSVGLGVGESSADEQIAKAVRWSVDNGATVINMSLTRNTLDWPPSWDEAFLYAMKKDVVIVAAAGNRGSGTTTVGAPATMPGVLAVAGVDRNGRASFDASSQGITIGVAAPSEALVGAVPGRGYYTWAGTSGSTPIVAGMVALVRSAHPGLSANEVINRVISTATAVGTVPSPIYGYGLMNAARAVAAPVVSVTANPLGDLSDWIHLHRRAETPTSTPSSTGDPAAAADPEPEQSLAPPSPGTAGSAFPTIGVLRDYGIPLAVFAAFGTLLLFVLRVARRQYVRIGVRNRDGNSGRVD